MAIGDPYLSRDALKLYLKFKSGDDVDNDLLDDVIASISDEINLHCGRQFQDAGAASARLYRTSDPGLLYVDDFHTTTGFVVETDEDDDGVFETTWSSDEYQLEPLNGVVEGTTGWPYWMIRAIDGDRQFPRSSVRRANCRVTARWGWSAVPSPVKQASRILASDTFGLKDARFGVAGSSEWGVLRVRDNPMAASKLERYVRIPLLAGE